MQANTQEHTPAPSLGRPQKGRGVRVDKNIHCDSEHLKIVDGMVQEERSRGDKSSSRSEHYYKAMEMYLKSLGKLKD